MCGRSVWCGVRADVGKLQWQLQCGLLLSIGIDYSNSVHVSCGAVQRRWSKLLHVVRGWSVWKFPGLDQL